MKSIIDKLTQTGNLTDSELLSLLNCTDENALSYLYSQGERVCIQNYGTSVYIRGLIELTNYCKNDCLYCGIRRSNKCAERYRLTCEQVLSCAKTGYNIGFRTFVLQGGEDPYFTDERIVEIVKALKSNFPDCAVTLSLGEKSYSSYKMYFDAGADRYLLRHETADAVHYGKLHPKELSLENRMQCLRDLKSIGYQTGCGFMVGSPYQTTENILYDIRFIQEFKPHMVGLGPFIPHKDTPFKDMPAGSLQLTLKCLSIIRLMLPDVLLPATTALGTIVKGGRELGIKSGANVIMPNLSPSDVRGKYLLYNNKLATGAESAEGLNALKNSLKQIDRTIEIGRGDHKTCALI
ncbi:MAG: [FeFe] hydrogenase H-cluster radical SAM maturase HydE [Acutalibacteraceae bacterium]